MISFPDLSKKLNRNILPRLLCLDPGETTGWAIFDGVTLAAAGQLATRDIPTGGVAINELIKEYQPKIVVLEEYRVYAHKLKQHTWSELHTPRLIGAIEILCTLHELPYYKQSASMAKGFASDKKLKEWEFYGKGRRHGNDAIRHGIYFTLFHKFEGEES